MTPVQSFFCLLVGTTEPIARTSNIPTVEMNAFKQTTSSENSALAGSNSYLITFSAI